MVLRRWLFAVDWADDVWWFAARRPQGSVNQDERCSAPSGRGMGQAPGPDIGNPCRVRLLDAGGPVEPVRMVNGLAPLRAVAARCAAQPQADRLTLLRATYILTDEDVMVPTALGVLDWAADVECLRTQHDRLAPSILRPGSRHAPRR